MSLQTLSDNLRITFVSNFFNHHEKPLCDELYRLTNGKFTFVQTIPVDDERVSMGWETKWSDVPYLQYAYRSKEDKEQSLAFCSDSDVLIFGSAPYQFISERVKRNKLTFYYAERLFKKGFWRAFYPPSAIKIIHRFIIPGNRKNFHVLCASAYSSYDLSRINAFNKKTYRWAHFTEFKKYDLKQLMSQKSRGLVNILWVGRLIKLKHPDYAIALANFLRAEGYEFTLNIIGLGEMEMDLRRLVSLYGLSDSVTFLGMKQPEIVRDFMEKADIFISTSDFNEGWGAVITEAMNSGCSVVASHAIGSVPFLLRHKINGLIYKNGEIKDFYANVMLLMKDQKLREKLGRNGYNAISDLWNAKVGAERLISLSGALLSRHAIPHYDEGPCSIAPTIKNNWWE